MKTRERLILEAYKLYVSKPYDQVTFTELEKAMGLSRGAILYHFKSKELLFNAVIERFVLEESSISSLITEDCKGLLDFIKQFVAGCKDEIQKYRSYGIFNMNLAKFYIEFHAINHFENAAQLGKAWMDKELIIWGKILSKAMQSNEIKDDLNLETLASVFINIYQGISFAGIIRSKGYDIALLEKEFMMVYNLIKRN